MPVYAVGDVQGCHRSFLALLERVGFDDAADRVWFAGDLVNRGPRSLETLRWAYARRDRDACVLGNHDLNLLAVARGVRPTKGADTLDGILQAPDRDELLTWLLERPLMHREGDHVLVHAGLYPMWTLEEAETEARSAEAALRADASAVLRDAYFGKPVERWAPDLPPRDRLRFVLDVFTRMRVVSLDGRIDSPYEGRPGEAYEPWAPWFRVPHRRGDDTRVLFGHWSSLGYHEAPGAVCLDSGCVWGQTLTAYRLDNGAVYSQPNVE